MKVFLGGTCNGDDYRDSLIPLLKCDYFNPVIKGEWSEEHRLREVKERKECDYVLYVITNNLGGVYSIAEVVDDSNKQPERTIFCNLYNPDIASFTYNRIQYQKMYKSLEAVANLIRDNGAFVFKDLEEVANFLNTRTLNCF